MAMTGSGVCDTNSSLSHKLSPVLTIKRHPRFNGGWQNFIEREQTSVDCLLKDSFAQFCKDLDTAKGGNNELIYRPKYFYNAKSLGRLSSSRSILSPSKKSTMSQLQSLHGSQTMADSIEQLYAPMKNLSQQLPYKYTSGMKTLPSQRLLKNREHHCLPPDDDHMSDICSVMGDIPPAPLPVLSHAILQEGLGHELPLQTIIPSKKSQESFRTPPLPPRRTSSVQHDLGRVQQLQQQHAIIYANPNPLPNRSSLMSTGSSESSGDSGVPNVETDISAMKFGIASLNMKTKNSSNSFPSLCEEHRSISNLEDSSEFQYESSSCSSVNMMNSTSVSYGYVPMQAFPGNKSDAIYMNMLYSAIKKQNCEGTVENAMSPYITMINKSDSRLQSKFGAKSESSIDTIYASPNIEQKPNLGRSTSIIGKLRSSSRKSAKHRVLAQWKELIGEIEYKRRYRVALNLFNTKPEAGIDFMVDNKFIDISPSSFAKFLRNNAGLSKEKIGLYLGNIRDLFAMKVLSSFMDEFDFSGQKIDKALRNLLQYIRISGDAQHIHTILTEFGKRYNKCNSTLQSADSTTTLASAIILLNTDLHTASIKQDKKMSLIQFITNLKNADVGQTFETKLLKSIYKGIRKHQLKTGADHVLQTQLIQQRITGSKISNLALSHRRLVCFCRFTEILDINSQKESSLVTHQRDLFLFNDLLVVTKMSTSSMKENKTEMYNFRDSFTLSDLEVALFQTDYYKFGIKISNKYTKKVVINLNADSEHDQYKFVMDLHESIFEMREFEAAWIKYGNDS